MNDVVKRKYENLQKSGGISPNQTGLSSTSACYQHQLDSAQRFKDFQDCHTFKGGPEGGVCSKDISNTISSQFEALTSISGTFYMEFSAKKPNDILQRPVAHPSLLVVNQRSNSSLQKLDIQRCRGGNVTERKCLNYVHRCPANAQ